MADTRAKVVTELTLRDRASSEMRKAQRSIVSDAKRIVGGFVLATASVAAFREGIISSVQASIEHEKALKALEVAGFKNVAAVDAAAEAMQRQVGVQSDLIIQQIAIARQYGATEQRAVQLVQASFDLSAAIGVSQEQAFRQLAKTLGGYAGELAESLPAIKQLTAEQLKNGEAVDIIQKKYAGAAEQIASTTGGQLAIAQAAYEDLQQAQGDAILKTLEFVTVNQQGEGSISSFGTAIDSAAGILTKYTENLDILIAKIREGVPWAENLGDLLVRLGTFGRVSLGDLNVAGGALRVAGQQGGPSGGGLEPVNLRQPPQPPAPTPVTVDPRFSNQAEFKKWVESLEDGAVEALRASAASVPPNLFDDWAKALNDATIKAYRARTFDLEQTLDQILAEQTGLNEFNPFAGGTTPFRNRFGRDPLDAAEGKRQLANEMERGAINDRINALRNEQNEWDTLHGKNIEGVGLATDAIGMMWDQMGNGANEFGRQFISILDQILRAAQGGGGGGGLFGFLFDAITNIVPGGGAVKDGILRAGNGGGDPTRRLLSAEPSVTESSRLRTQARQLAPYIFETARRGQVSRP